jgi:hypothetical protein
VIVFELGGRGGMTDAWCRLLMESAAVAPRVFGMLGNTFAGPWPAWLLKEVRGAEAPWVGNLCADWHLRVKGMVSFRDGASCVVAPFIWWSSQQCMWCALQLERIGKLAADSACR